MAVSTVMATLVAGIAGICKSALTMAAECQASPQCGRPSRRDALLKQRVARIPMGFMGDGRDTANAALFLASDEARFVTGTDRGRRRHDSKVRLAFGRC
jgi:NAD(P)-dependent dehydrogenase (short-subunit alcohol dehydrogenase family)